jgi:hypothetical protein
MISGKVVAKRDSSLVLQVDDVPRQWRHSRAENAESMVGKRVLVDGSGHEKIQRFVQQVEVGESLELDVAHRDGEVLTVLELTAAQRKRVAEE